jgi:hypothetical protein
VVGVKINLYVAKLASIPKNEIMERVIKTNLING